MKDEQIEELKALKEITDKSGHAFNALSRMKNRKGVHLVNALIDGAVNQETISLLLTPPYLTRKVINVNRWATNGGYIAIECMDKKEKFYFFIFDYEGQEVYSAGIPSLSIYSTPIITTTKVSFFRKLGRLWYMTIIPRDPEKRRPTPYDSGVTASSLNKAWPSLMDLPYVAELCKEGGTHFLDLIDNYRQNENLLFAGWNEAGGDGEIPLRIKGREYHLGVCNSSLYLIPD